ncbi:hypothetical protein HNP84_009845 [Thermocatellispora tengchongensis]|uniref:Uncharacterized protein n=1 Tax=Thermocatellispora tengchongensis TaxID=1073253 RepID=A0A840PQN6_9ACTN|nr:hypothetical protein [Thermocatellispora tengchongensis]MBB5140080.1 hypothetical protein [Thermocatellispora tengchongensis]
MCEHRTSRRRDRRAQMTKGHAFARAGRPAHRRGWFAHRAGVTCCTQAPERLHHHDEPMRGRGHDLD